MCGLKVLTNFCWMTLLTASSKIGGNASRTFVDREVISPSVPHDVLEGVLPRCSSNLNSSDDVLDPVADHADVQLADWGLVIDPVTKFLPLFLLRKRA